MALPLIRDNSQMKSRYVVLSDSQRELISAFMPQTTGKAGRPFNDNCLMTDGIMYRYRAGLSWRDLPGRFGP